MSKKNIVLVGIGPHAKRIYLPYLKKKKINLSFVIDLDSQKDSIRQYLDDNGFKNTKIYAINDKYKNYEHLPKNISSNLLSICKIFEISHFIIATEPKAHFMYLEFALKNNINVLTDKPISVVENMTSLHSIEKVRKQYYEILELARKSKGSCKVMCQRQYHKGYEKIKEILTNVVNEYRIPITDIEIFHSDGAWEMLHDLDKENHPYKYGYGKLFHSGYHFIDLLSDFIKINDSLSGNKKIVSGEVFSKVVTPNDELNILDMEDYNRLFKNQNMPSFYDSKSKLNLKKYGEKDYHGLLSFYNRDGFTITTASLNLLHNGVSRRSWIKTKDFYKSNGRIRHERINIEIGHLLNIQVHSYQSKEICDRTDNEEQVGGLEHFDIYFFNNPLIDKEPFKEIHLGDMYSNKEKEEFEGYNELSREVFLTNFLNNKDCKGDIEDQALAIEILYSCAKGIHNHYSNKNKVEKIEVRNNYTYRFISKRLKNYSKPFNNDLEKETIKYNTYYKDFYTIVNNLKYIQSINKYEVFISIDDTKNMASSLLDKTFNNKFMASIYYKLLEYIINKKKVTYLENLIEKSK